MNRRRFLTATAVSAASAPCAAGVAAETSAPGVARRPLRVGFLGCSHSHAAAKIRLVLASPEWEMVGVAESEEAERSVARELGAPLVTQAELLDRAEVVAVESAVRNHASHARLALEAGKHVHLEKPAAHRLDALREVVAEARARQRLLQVGYMWRYHPGIRFIREAVARGWLGDVYQVRGFIASRVEPDRRKEWAEFSGGVLFELGSHLIDATVRLLGRPKAVTPFLRHHGAFNDSLTDNSLVVFEYEKATAVLTATALQAGGTPQRSFQVLGSNGTATLMPLEPGTLRLDLLESAGPYPKGPQDVPLAEYRRYIDDFAELAAAARGEAKLSAGLDDELMVGETVLQACGMG